MRLCVGGGVFLALESGTGARWIPPRQGTDSRGLPGITFDLGTRNGPVPIQLSARRASLVTVARLGFCFSRKAAPRSSGDRQLLPRMESRSARSARRTRSRCCSSILALVGDQHLERLNTRYLRL